MFQFCYYCFEKDFRSLVFTSLQNVGYRIKNVYVTVFYKNIYTTVLWYNEGLFQAVIFLSKMAITGITMNTTITEIGGGQMLSSTNCLI